MLRTSTTVRQQGKKQKMAPALKIRGSLFPQDAARLAADRLRQNGMLTFARGSTAWSGPSVTEPQRGSIEDWPFPTLLPQEEDDKVDKANGSHQVRDPPL